VALDRGPGISDIGEALRDGYSTAGSPGTGLGAIRRLCSRFDIYSRPAEGTAVLAQLWPNHTEDIVPWPVELGAIAVPKPDEEISGDAWAARATAHGARVLVADGLGHGLEAAEAAVRACTVFRESSDTLTTVLDAIHGALRHTRGAAVAAAEIDLEERVVRFAGVGNISGAIIAPERDYNMVSHNGTMGHEVRKIQEFTYQWPEESVLVLHSDGLSRRWDLRQRPGLLSRHPTLVAAVLHRDYRRERDDSTVVVARESSRRVG
jgi:hypothetical protein